MGSLPIASRKTKCRWALSKVSTTRSACSSAGLTGYVMRNTSDSRYSAACCRKFNKLSLLTKAGQRRDDEVQRQSNKIAEIFGTRLHRRHRGKLATVIDQIEHGHHVFRAYFKSAFLKQYEKFSTFLRNELCSNNLTDFGLKKGLDHLDAVRQTFQAITDRFAGFQAQWLNVHVDFPLLQRIALPIAIGSVRYPGIKIHDTRVIRLCEAL